MSPWSLLQDASAGLARSLLAPHISITCAHLLSAAGTKALRNPLNAAHELHMTPINKTAQLGKGPGLPKTSIVVCGLCWCCLVVACPAVGTSRPRASSRLVVHPFAVVLLLLMCCCCCAIVLLLIMMC